jgi:hypothetical protein
METTYKQPILDLPFRTCVTRLSDGSKVTDLSFGNVLFYCVTARDAEELEMVIRRAVEKHTVGFCCD